MLYFTPNRLRFVDDIEIYTQGKSQCENHPILILTLCQILQSHNIYFFSALSIKTDRLVKYENYMNDNEII